MSQGQSRIIPPTPILLLGPGLPALSRYFQPTTAGKDDRFWRAAKYTPSEEEMKKTKPRRETTRGRRA